MWISTFVLIWMVKRVVWAMFQWSRFLKKFTFVILTMICPMEMTIKWVWSVLCDGWDPFMNWIIWHQKDVAHNYTLIYPKQIKLLSGCAPIVKYCFKNDDQPYGWCKTSLFCNISNKSDPLMLRLNMKRALESQSFYLIFRKCPFHNWHLHMQKCTTRLV